MLQNEIKFTELSTSFLGHLGIWSIAVSQVATAGPHSPMSVIGTYHCHWRTEGTAHPLFAIHFLFTIESLKERQNNQTNIPTKTNKKPTPLC